MPLRSPARTRKVRKLRGFISYSSDTKKFANALVALGKKISSETNRTEDWIIAFETHEINVTPDVGPNAQAVIDKQIGDDLDIFVMLLWSRIGSKIPGTDTTGLEHEFNKAMARRATGGDKPVIAVFFCDAPMAPSQIDCDQLAGVKAFKHSMQATYYKTFKDKQELVELVKLTLKTTAAIRDRKSPSPKKAADFADVSKPLPGLAKKVADSYPDEE